MKEPLLISACLLGTACRYDGKSQKHPQIDKLLARYHVVPVCPEQLGGLPTPRSASERQGELVISKNGADVTAEYRRGAEQTLQLARLFGTELAVLKARSPSCGSGRIYDGAFSGQLVDGDGVTAELLKANGIQVLDESRLDQLLK